MAISKTAVFAVIAAIGAFALRVWLNGCTCSDVVDLRGKNVIITGGTGGIGLETAKTLFRMGANVILPVRNLTKGQLTVASIQELNSSGTGSVSAMSMDLNDITSVTKFVDKFNSNFKSLDILINNAGTWPHSHRNTTDGLQEIFQVNHLSHFLLTGLLLPKLRAAGNKTHPSRVVTLSSGLHFRGQLEWKDLEAGRVMPIASYEPMQAYSSSKLLNVIFAVELQRRIDASPQFAGLVTSSSVHPGVIVTDLHRDDKEHRPWFYMLYWTVVNLVGKSIPQGAQTSLYAAISPAAVQRGAYFADCTAVPPHAGAQPPAAAENGERLWKLSVALLKNARVAVKRLAL